MTEIDKIRNSLDRAEGKLDKVASILGHDLAEPMADTLKEIRSSNRSRWIVLAAMLVMCVVTIGSSFYVLSKIRRMQYRYMVQTVRLNKLIDLAEKTARPENRSALRTLQKLSDTTPQSVVEAAAALVADAGTDR